ncbi:MAG: hypothetical protein Q9M13_00865 [Mariprofundales bacterium]|nr:hypothetical protein [Mariprofundales bacterium]
MNRIEPMVIVGAMVATLLLQTVSPTPLQAAEPRAAVLKRLNAMINELEAQDEALRPKPKPKPKVVVKKRADVTLMERARKAAVKIGRPLRVVIDVRSDHSDGKHSFADLREMAVARGIEALAFTEHDRTAVRYGIDPVSSILGYTYERRSLYTTGVDHFIDDLTTFRQQNGDMLFFAGTESTPDYFWTGIPLQDNFILHDSDKHIITLGVESAEQVESLPSYNLTHMHSSFKISVVFWCLTIFALMLLLLYRRQRSIALLLFASFVAFMATWLMQLRNEVDPDQDFLTTAKEHHLFTVWAHPGTQSGMRTEALGVKVKTDAYSDKVFAGPYADAFAALYGDSDLNTRIGGAWDRYLMKYVKGVKREPLWAVSAGDFHYQGGFDTFLGDYPMDVWVRERTPSAIVIALQGGHNVSWKQIQGQNIGFRTLAVADGRGEVALPGESLHGTGPYFLVASAEWLKGSSSRASSLIAQIVVDGLLMDSPTMDIGAGKVMVWRLKMAVGDHVVRLRMPEQHGIRMESNPFFISVVAEKKG